MLRGFVEKSHRLSKKLCFVKLQDGSQIIVHGRVSAPVGSVVEAHGTLNGTSLDANEFRIISRAEALPMQSTANEDVRLKYRYLDLRRPSLHKNIVHRSNSLFKIRSWFHANNFVEIETPTLFKSTPEGAREFLVPTRSGGSFALAQSPQQFKQLLMVAGFAKYFQIARCYRDEDMRADRQPEFTQIDLEMSFATQKEIMQVTENMLRSVCFIDSVVLDYTDAIRLYGCDKPDLRVPYTIVNNCLRIPKKDVNMTEERIDLLEKFVSTIGAHLVIDEEIQVRGDLKTLSQVRKKIIEVFFNDLETLSFVWIVNFPLFTNGKSTHHPFTAPLPQYMSDLMASKDLQHIKAQHYDLVLNGQDIGGGSIRIHDAKVQQKILEIVGAESSHFKHLLDAFNCGCPPHGGIAIGLDRLLSILLKCNSVRDVIAFPKSHAGRDLMTGAPNKP